MGADSNAHSVLWGCEETNKRGEEVEELILHFNLNVANRVANSPSPLRGLAA